MKNNESSTEVNLNLKNSLTTKTKRILRSILFCLIAVLFSAYCNLSTAFTPQPTVFDYWFLRISAGIIFVYPFICTGFLFLIGFYKQAEKSESAKKRKNSFENLIIDSGFYAAGYVLCGIVFIIIDLFQQYSFLETFNCSCN